METVELRDPRVVDNPNVYPVLRVSKTVFKEALELCEGGQQFVSDVYHGTGSSILPWIELDGILLPYRQTVEIKRRRLRTGLRVAAGYPADNSDNISTSLYFTVAVRQHALTYTNGQYPLVFGINHSYMQSTMQEGVILPNKNPRASEKEYPAVPLGAISMIYAPSERLNDILSWTGNVAPHAKALSLEAVLFIFSIWEDFLQWPSAFRNLLITGVDQYQKDRFMNLFVGMLFNSVFHFNRVYRPDEAQEDEKIFDLKNACLFANNEYKRIRRISDPEFFRQRQCMLPSELVTTLESI